MLEVLGSPTAKFERKNSNSDDFTYPAHQNIALRPSATNRLSSSESRKALLMAFGQVNMLL
jgi:hypothetical protein